MRKSEKDCLYILYLTIPAAGEHSGALVLTLDLIVWISALAVSHCYVLLTVAEIEAETLLKVSPQRSNRVDM